MTEKNTKKASIRGRVRDLLQKLTAIDEASLNIFKVKTDGTVIRANSIPGVVIVDSDKARGAVIIYYEGTLFVNCKFKLLKNCCLIVEKTRYRINNLAIMCHNGWGNFCYIGEDFSCNGAEFRLWEYRDIYIGQDVMFSWQIMLFTGDGHSITDFDGNLINPADDIVISDHVWIGQGVKVLKGSFVNKNCIVAMNTLINKKINESGVLIAGCPGRIVRKNIQWSRKNMSRPESDHPVWMNLL